MNSTDTQMYVLPDELAELRKDNARLDWLERNANFIEVGHADIGATRAAIDEAMESRNR